MMHEWITTAIVATMVPGCLDDEVVSTTAAASVFSLDVMINGAPLTPETNNGQLDYGRVVVMDGSSFVTTTTSMIRR
jgi:hypothetical protein